MPHRIRRLHRTQNALPYSLLFALVAVAGPLHWLHGPRITPAAAGTTSHRSFPARAAGRCTLSPGQQLGAVDAFSKMMPVFHHPRCFNCHGGFDITADEHEGSDAAQSSGLDPRSLLTLNERKELHAQCGSCHDNVRGTLTRLDGTQLSGWLVAPLPMLWDGKSDEELCLQMKRFESDGDQFIDHIETDHKEIQFVEAAFNGDRALGDALAGYNLVIEKPPGTQGELLAKARKWVNALHGIWKDPPECGCVKPKVELTMKSEVTGTADRGRISGDFSATVPLKADTAGAPFRGEAPIRYGGLKTPPIPPGCRSTYKPGTGVVAVKEVRFTGDDEGHTKIFLALVATDNSGVYNLSCPGVPRALIMPVPPFANEWKFVHEPDRKDGNYVFEDFEVPANAPAAEGRTLIGRKQVTRSVKNPGIDVTAKTTFELWALPSK
jgi:hypothetical protein